MAKSTKTVELFEVVFTTEEDSKLTFENVLLSQTIKDFEAFIGGKHVSVTILEKGAYIIGMVETIRRNNIPPKKHRKEKTISALGLRVGEGLAYGNVFLYERRRKILFYEINKFGSYVNHFLNALLNCCTEDERWTEQFNVTVNAILKPDEYIRLRKMNYYKSFDIKFANPKKLLQAYTHKHDALGKTMSLSNELSSDVFSGKFEVKSKKQGGHGLSHATMRDLITKARKLLNTEVGSENIQKLQIKGYAIDQDDVEKLEPIDLLADRYLGEIKLEEPRENVDLLEGQRKSEIKRLYSKCQPDLNNMFS